MQRPAAIANPVAIYFQLCSRDELSLRCTHSCVIVINHEPTTHQAKRVMTNSLGLSTNTIHQPGFPKHAIAGNFSLGAKQRLLSVKCVAAKQKSNACYLNLPNSIKHGVF